MDNRTGAVQFEGTAVDASTYRRAANRHILSVAPKLVVSIYRLDPGAPGGASRKSTWEAVLMTRVGAS
ncbi:hypothetical protein [Demequina sp. TTPB684]|nr:hypothetical protein [Demequina sp. TTPB684]